MSLPFISVIIIAHDNKEFLMEAAMSACDQSLRRENFEIICVKNFTEELFDSELSKYTDVVINSQSRSYGGKARAALQAARGYVICFLDYDDLFFKDKLRIVYETFKKNKDLVYFHNGRTSRLSEFVTTGSVLTMEPVKSHSIDLKEAHYRDLIRFFRNYPDFNSSSISVRKSILAGKETEIESMVMHPDTFLLFSALESDGMLLDSSMVLTFYRVHHSTTNHFTMSKATYFSAKTEYYGRTESDWSIIRSFLKKENSLRLCDCEAIHNSLLRKLYDLGTGRAELFCEVIKFVRCIRSRRFLNMLLLTMTSLLVFLCPLLGRYVYFAMSTRLVRQS